MNKDICSKKTSFSVSNFLSLATIWNRVRLYCFKSRLLCSNSVCKFILDCKMSKFTKVGQRNLILLYKRLSVTLELKITGRTRLTYH